MLENYRQLCARIGSPNSAMFDAERAITRARRNIGLIVRPVERERDVSAVAFADDQHLGSVSVICRGAMCTALMNALIFIWRLPIPVTSLQCNSARTISLMVGE